MVVHLASFETEVGVVITGVGRRPPVPMPLGVKIPPGRSPPVRNLVLWYPTPTFPGTFPGTFPEL